MGRQRTIKPIRKQATNVTLPAELLNEARHLRVNLSQAAEAGLRQAVAVSRRQNWLAANMDAMNAWNTHVDAHGLPLDEYRQF